MRGILVSSGLHFLRNVLKFFQTKKDENVEKRLEDYFGEGVIQDSQLELEDTALAIVEHYPYITIGTGTGFKSAERMAVESNILYGTSVIEILETDVTASSTTGNQNIQLTSGNGNYYIWMKYQKVLDTSSYTLHPISNEPIYYKINDSYQIRLTFNVSTNPDPDKYIYIGRAILSGTTITISYTNRIYSTLKSTTISIGTQPYGDTLQDHIESVGHGAVSGYNPHGIGMSDIEGLEIIDIIGLAKEGFNNGIYDSDNNALATHINNAVLFYKGVEYTGAVVVSQLNADETVYIDGYRIKGAVPLIADEDVSGGFPGEVGTDAFVGFKGAPDPDTVGTWYIGLERALIGDVQRVRVIKTTTLADLKVVLSSIYFDGNTIWKDSGMADFSNTIDLRRFGLTWSDQIVHNAAGTNLFDDHAIFSQNLDVRGSAVFNEDSADKDFRIESNGNANMFFLDGGLNAIGIAKSAPAATLDINGNQIITPAGTTTGLTIDQEFDERGILIDSESDNFNAIQINAKWGMVIFQDRTGGRGLLIQRNDGLEQAEANALVLFTEENAEATQPVLQITNAGSGNDIIASGRGIPDLLYDVHRQDIVANSAKTDQTMRKGWTFKTGGAAPTQSIAITFGITFDEPPIVLVSAPGSLVNVDPTTIDDLNAVGLCSVNCYGITTTGCTIIISSLAGGVLGNTRRYGAAWMAIGTKAR